MANIQTISINRIYKVKEFDLLTIANKVGNMYICIDSGKMYYDETTNPDGRKVYAYISVRTINDLMYNITPSINTSYYVWEDNSLWLWQNKWITLYSDITYPSAYIYDDSKNIEEVYRYDSNPYYPADDNGLLKDGSVVVRDKNRIIKGKLYIDDGKDNLVISGYFGGGIRFLPNGKQATEGELYIADEGYSYINSEFRTINNEFYVDYSNNTEYDTSEYPNEQHLYKVLHEGDINNKAYKEIIGDGINTEYVIEHNIGTEDIIVQFRDTVTNKQIAIENEIIDSNSIRVESQEVIETDRVKVLIYSI